jgi:hypothetical protein
MRFAPSPIDIFCFILTKEEEDELGDESMFLGLGLTSPFCLHPKWANSR